MLFAFSARHRMLFQAAAVKSGRAATERRMKMDLEEEEAELCKANDDIAAAKDTRKRWSRSLRHTDTTRQQQINCLPPCAARWRLCLIIATPSPV
jgi:hypothetical protein